jgi:hippurate hydrolase
MGAEAEDPSTPAPSHHSPLFTIEPDPSIKSGVEAMVIGAMTLMPR